MRMLRVLSSFPRNCTHHRQGRRRCSYHISSRKQTHVSYPSVIWYPFLTTFIFFHFRSSKDIQQTFAIKRFQASSFHVPRGSRAGLETGYLATISSIERRDWAAHKHVYPLIKEREARKKPAALSDGGIN